MSLLPAKAAARTIQIFDSLPETRADALLALIGMHARDGRPHRIDLGVGVYRDDEGNTPVLRCVKAAEDQLQMTQTTKAYLGGEGDVRFIEALEPIVFGSERTGLQSLRGIQTPGGTGALRLAAELIARAHPGATMWMGAPTWPNHAPIAKAARIRVSSHAYFNATSGRIQFDAMMMDLARGLAAGDVVLLHGCCHNPTGADLSFDQWHSLAELMVARGAIPLIDLAYQGLGDGLEADARGMRFLVEHVPEALIAYSCDKNFGLYRDRVGALWVKTENTASADLVVSSMLALARSLWSMPPDHGAAVVRIILDDPQLERLWRMELETMRGRIAELRFVLASTHERLQPLAGQRGMFATLPLSPDGVRQMREEHAVYMAESGRINIAGLRHDTVSSFANAFSSVLNSQHPS